MKKVWPEVSTQRPYRCCISRREKVFKNRLFPIPPSVLIVKETEEGKCAEVTEQDSTTVPKFAVRSFFPPRESCWGVPSPNPAYAPQSGRKEASAFEEKEKPSLG